MSNLKCENCGYNEHKCVAQIVGSNGTVTLCLNCSAEKVYEYLEKGYEWDKTLRFENSMDFIDEITGKPGAVKYIMEFEDGDAESYVLEKSTMLRLLNYNLTPYEHAALVDKHTWEPFLLHEDFYDDNHIALQSTVEDDKNLYWVQIEERVGEGMVYEKDHLAIMSSLQAEEMQYAIGYNDRKAARLKNCHFTTIDLEQFSYASVVSVAVANDENTTVGTLVAALDDLGLIDCIIEDRETLVNFVIEKIKEDNAVSDLLKSLEQAPNAKFFAFDVTSYANRAATPLETIQDVVNLYV